MWSRPRTTLRKLLEIADQLSMLDDLKLHFQQPDSAEDLTLLTSIWTYRKCFNMVSYKWSLHGRICSASVMCAGDFDDFSQQLTIYAQLNVGLHLCSISTF